jgi:hypothetical protein
MATTQLPSIGTWLGNSFGSLKTRWFPLTLLGISGALLSMLGAVLVYGGAGLCVYFFTDKEVLARFADPAAFEALMADPTFQMFFLVIHALAFLVSARLGCWFGLAAFHVACDPGLGAGAALKKARHGSMGFLVLLLLHQGIVGIGMAALVLPGLVLAVFLGFAPFVYARNQTGILGALGGSWRLVSGNFPGVLGRMLVLGLVCGAIAIVPVLGWIAAPCLGMLAWAHLYADLGAPATRTATARTSVQQVQPV